MAKKVLIVDDEHDIVDLLVFNLQNEGYATAAAYDGAQAIALAHSERPDLILLDIMLPEKDGYEVLRELRGTPETRRIPVIFLTAKDSEIDEVIGLELGADDYIVKPISIRTLLARIKKVLRKAPESAAESSSAALRFGDLIIDPEKYSVTAGNRNVVLTKKEFDILYYLAQRPGRVVTRRIFLDELWEDNVVVIDRTVDVHVRKIREKLGEPYASLIETIKGVGYRFRAE